MEERAKLNQRNKHIDQIAKLDELGLGDNFLGQVEASEALASAHLGTSADIISNMQRNENAYKNTQAWQKSISEAFRIQEVYKKDE